MRKPRTHVLIAVDASCSMLGVAKGVRVGINAYVADLCADTKREYLVTIITFAEQYRTLCAHVPPAQVPVLDSTNYVTGGQTGMLDALGQTLTTFDATVTDLTDDDTVIMLMASDGGDNWSVLYSPQQIADMVDEREARGWTFLHLAAGPQAIQYAPVLGLRHVIAIAKADLARRATYRGAVMVTRAVADGVITTGDITAMIEREMSAAS